MDEWSIGIVERPISTFLTNPTLSDVQWLMPTPAERRAGPFAADPFGLPATNGVEVLYEGFDRVRWAGRLERRAWSPIAGWGGPVAIMPADDHRSYPFAFHADGAVWCTPEQAWARSVTLYRAATAAGLWEPEAVLVSGFAALDPTITHWDGRWWLWCTDAERGPQTRLHLWWAPHLLGPWTAHGEEPVKVDVRSARPAGTPFTVDGRLFRPAQDSSSTYGGRVAICRIDEMDVGRYRESVVTVVEPDPAGPFPDGVHTLSAVGERTLVDGKRRRWAARTRLGHLARRESRRLASATSRRLGR
jgi:hypothetical protein